MKKLLCNKKIYVSVFSFLIICFYGALFAYAQVDNVPTKYTPIVDIPGLDGDSYSTEGYVQALYYLAITVAALLAMYKIMEGGIRWMFDGLVTGKEEAKQQIQGAIFGLLIVLSAVLVLNTINVNITNLNMFGNAPALDIEGEVPEVIDVSYGTRLYNDPNDTEVQNLIETCRGEVVTWGAGGGGGHSGGIGTAGSIGCFIPVSTIDAEPGDAFDSDLYDPAKADLAQVNFEQTCTANDGFIYMSECIPKLVDADDEIKIGDTLDLSDAYDMNAHDAVVIYQENCPGKVTASVPAHTISCVALDDNPADDLQELECQMINKVYNPVLESCF